MEQKLKEAGFINRSLHEHQQDGLTWLCTCFETQNGCILADEMGLGKTSQSLAFLSLRSSKTRPSLVIAPLSVMGSWESEFKSFTPSLKIIKYYGTSESRSSFQNVCCDVVITSYEMVLKDAEYFQSCSWNLMIVDEGHRLKNCKGLTNREFREIESNFRLMLTGTPVQNNLNELYTLLSFVDEQSFPLADLEDFCSRYEQETHNCELHELMRPFVMRRTKNQVAKDLPPIQQSIMFCHLTGLQKNLYKGFLVKNPDIVDFTVNTTSIQNTIMQLRKCSNHPYMFQGVEPEPFCMGGHLIEASGKLLALDKILKYCTIHQHRILIFSQFTLTLDILQDYMSYRGFTFERLDGSVRDQDRVDSINNFSSKQVFCFLLSTKAGGVGLNLTAADTVIFFDNDWNPQNDIQASARAHRIGQKKPVKVIRLISRNTVDEYILRRMESKLKLTKRVVVEGSFSSHSVAPEDSKTLADMLMFGISDLFDEESKFDDAIDEVLGESSSDGKWLFDKDDTGDKVDGLAKAVDDFYDFEGKNYRNKQTENKKRLTEIISTSKSDVKTSSTGPTVTGSRIRKTVAISDSELLEREGELEEHERAAVDRRRVTREAKKEEHWRETGYVSTALPRGTLVDEDEDVDLEYVVGDVSAPGKAGIILHCTDSNGEWGTGGLFTALSRHSSTPETAYELAKDMDNLRQGQCHVCEYVGDLQVALLICIKRGPSSIKLDHKSLSEALTALGRYARANELEVHMPRIGVSADDWYGAERFLRKCLTGQGVRTTVYYFSRRRTKRPRPADDDQPGPSAPGPYNGIQRNNKRKSRVSTLPDSFSGKVVYLDPEMKQTESVVIKRHVIAANGDVQAFIDKNVTHIVSYRSDFKSDSGKCSDDSMIVNPYDLDTIL